jgi:hypothetical protein
LGSYRGKSELFFRHQQRWGVFTLQTKTGDKIMNKLVRILAAMTVVFAFSHAAFAGFHVEPFVGYSLSGDFDQEVGGSTLNSGDYTSNGPQLGARVGYGMLGFFGAVEYELSPMLAAPDDNDYDDVDINQTLMGVALGYEFPIAIRAYATYIFSAEGKGSLDNVDPVYRGSGIKLGVGYTGLPFIAINLEVTQLTYDDVESDSSSFDDDFDSFTANYYTLSVSAPFDF